MTEDDYTYAGRDTMSEGDLARELYGNSNGDALRAAAQGLHLIREHGFTLEALADMMPADSGSPAADLDILARIHRNYAHKPSPVDQARDMIESSRDRAGQRALDAIEELRDALEQAERAITNALAGEPCYEDRMTPGAQRLNEVTEYGSAFRALWHAAAYVAKALEDEDRTWAETSAEEDAATT